MSRKHRNNQQGVLQPTDALPKKPFVISEWPVPPQKKILYSIQTCPKYWFSRQEAIRRTWGNPEFNDIDLIFNVNSDGYFLGSTMCMIAMMEAVVDQLPAYEWYFCGCDDNYVWVNNLEREIDQYKTEEPVCIGTIFEAQYEVRDEYLLNHIPREVYPLPAIGGCCYVLNRPALVKLVEYFKSEKKILLSRVGDAATAYWFKFLNIKLIDNKKFQVYGNVPINEHQADNWANHRVTVEQMRYAYELEKSKRPEIKNMPTVPQNANIVTSTPSNTLHVAQFFSTPEIPDAFRVCMDQVRGTLPAGMPYRLFSCADIDPELLKKFPCRTGAEFATVFGLHYMAEHPQAIGIDADVQLIRLFQPPADGRLYLVRDTNQPGHHDLLENWVVRGNGDAEFFRELCKELESRPPHLQYGQWIYLAINYGRLKGHAGVIPDGYYEHWHHSSWMEKKLNGRETAF